MFSMSDISNLYTVPENRPVPKSIVKILSVVDHVATTHGCRYVVVGATARDLMLYHVFGIPASRATRDVDFAIAVESWDKFHSVRNALVSTGHFLSDKTVHRLHCEGMPVDLMPFGGLAENGTILWPPSLDTAMSVAGFEDALMASVRVAINPTLTIPVVSLAALTILKVFAWHERNVTDKDALDLFRIISTYSDASNTDRLYSLESPHMEKFEFRLDYAGAALAGEDSRVIVSPDTLEKLRAVSGTGEFIDRLAERIRSSQWPFEPEKLSYIRAVLDAYFSELLT